MIDDIKKSFTSAFDKRARSPLYGTLLISWFVWNWKAIYYITIVSSEIDFDERIYQLNHNITNPWTLVWGPLISTAIILTGVEFISNYVYQLSLYYKKRRIDIKQKYEGKELLNIEQSFQLKEESKRAHEAAAKIYKEKDDIINGMRISIDELYKELALYKKSSEPVEHSLKNVMEKIKNDGMIQIFRKLGNELGDNSLKLVDFDRSLINYFLAIGLIKIAINNAEYYQLTEFGKTVHNQIPPPSKKNSTIWLD